MKLTRRQARENAFIVLFELSFGADLEEIIKFARSGVGEYALDEYGENLVREFLKNQESVDALIDANLKGWKADRVAKVNMAVLRLAITEINYSSEDMESIVINEAVEITKKYADETDHQFVNGLLGNLSRKKQAGEVASEVLSEEIEPAREQ